MELLMMLLTAAGLFYGGLAIVYFVGLFIARKEREGQ